MDRQIPEVADRETRFDLTKEEATEFFSELYYGQHHLPSKVFEHGYGWMVKDYSSMATFDYNQLTRFVVMCHDYGVRGEIKPLNFNTIKVCIWGRHGRSGEMSIKHPDLDTHLRLIREGLKKYQSPK